jgi:hypothetical protein
VARFYGLGAAEHELGEILRGRRDQVTIATKFGIEPSDKARMLARVQGPARAAMQAFDPLRQAVRRQRTAFRAPRRYDRVTAERSLTTSLRELGTDYVDILFVHGPDSTDAIVIDELVEFFEQARTAGKIRAWGVSGEPPFARTLSGELRGSCTQIRRSLAEPDLVGTVGDCSGSYLFGVMQPALQLLCTRFRTPAPEARSFSQRSGVDIGQASEISALLVAEAVLAAGTGKVIVGTTSIAHAAAAFEAGGRFSPDTVTAFRELASSTLATGQAPR